MSKEKKFITCDGNQAAAHIAYMFSEVAAIYPITPSSTMAEYVDEWSAAGKKNIFGRPVKVEEMQSEAGAAGALHGSLQVGALTTTFTASQGLLLMIPNMYKIAGELLPCVFHVTARSLAAHALSIFGDHADIYATRQTGFAMLASGSVQEVMNIAGIAHLATLKTRVPFMHFFDGFRTSHEIQKIEELQQEDLMKLVDWDALKAFRERALNPEHPVTRGTAQNSDIYFQAKEAGQVFYNRIPEVVEEYFNEINKLTGKDYSLFDYYGAEDAENIIIAMGSVTKTIKETVDYLQKQGKKVGVISVHLFRPFSTKHILKVIPKSVKRIAVLDRTKEVGANGEPLYLDVREMFYNMPNAPMVVGGRYGLSSKDTTPSQMISVFNNLELSEPKNHFTVGIVDDVNFSSLPILPDVHTAPEGTFEAKFYGLGSDGTVGANKNSIKIIGDKTNKYVQAYFAYDSKKSGGFTTSHLRFGNKPIRATYLVNTPDFVACHVPSYIWKFNMLKGLKKGGVFLLSSIWGKEETLKHLPDHIKKYMADNDIKFYIINATQIAEGIGLGNRTNTIMQSAFFKIANVIPLEIAVDEMKKAAYKSFGKKGEEIVKMNYSAIDQGLEGYEQVEVSADWKNLDGTIKLAYNENGVPDFIKKIVNPINSQQGDDLPVSAFFGREDGTFENGTAAYEKRGIAINVPEWQSEFCIQCNQCAYVCPHAVIRPFLINKDEISKLPAGTPTLAAIGKQFEGHQFRIQVSPLDCTGCGNCADVCPAPKGKALVMKHLESQLPQAKNFEILHKEIGYKSLAPRNNVKNSQFAQPLFEFSGACGGCGETPYIKLITQLFGERMIVANATGCSSIYGGSAPSTPYCTNNKGCGPAWSNSLFEDNAEFGLGMAKGVEAFRDRITQIMQDNLATAKAEIKEAFELWLSSKDNAESSEIASQKVIEVCSKDDSEASKVIMSLKQYLIKKSVWIFGGDGWAYDIGFGGLDHVIASGNDVNILVMDTEVYSNTGGQSSKSTPIGAIAKFAASGKKIRKKDLAKIAMTYGYVYVAQVAMGANHSQYMNALKEAEAYPGPSLIIAYAPCINHGLKAGMGKTQAEEKKAVESGYWTLFRYNPMLEAEGKNPITVDSKEPDWDKFQDFIKGEVRYSSMIKAYPNQAEELFKLSEEDAKWRRNKLLQLASAYEPKKSE